MCDPYLPQINKISVFQDVNVVFPGRLFPRKKYFWSTSTSHIKEHNKELICTCDVCSPYNNIFFSTFSLFMSCD